VRRCELRGGALTQRALDSQHLWSPGEHGHAGSSEMPALVEHLRARLGVNAVYGLRRVAEHRPENAWRVAEPALSGGAKPDVIATTAIDAPAQGHLPFRRPPWLLHAPLALEAHRGRPRRGGPLEMLAGPERIESGWWDGGDVQRDYYVARSADGARLWIYRECGGARGWFLHGIFG